MTHKIELDAAPQGIGSRYPAPYDAPCAGRARRVLGDAAGLTQFGVNPTRLPARGFQSARDIAAITVNRWPHGYAYSADSGTTSR